MHAPRCKVNVSDQNYRNRITNGLVVAFLAVDAEGKSLEDVAKPLSVVAKPAQTIFRAGDQDSAGT